jgi:glucokinase
MKIGEKLYIGVDVGGTKILAEVVKPTGAVLSRNREQTPRKSSPKNTLATIHHAIRGAMLDAGADESRIAGIGMAVPGMVDAEKGVVLATPNLNLTGIAVGTLLQRKFNVPVVLCNDVNAGTVGEKWLGAARNARSVVGVFVGTGIGGGIILDNHLVNGYRGAAGEIGHMIVQPDGPVCGCGNRGCLESLASRTAIERDIRLAVKSGRKSLLEQTLDGDLSVIKSGKLADALRKKDPVVCEVVSRAAVVLGNACLSLRHLLDVEFIVLGGGVIEACGDFILPIVRKTLSGDTLSDVFSGKVVRSQLGDDAVALGAVALARQKAESTSLGHALRTAVEYPVLTVRMGRLSVDGKKLDRDVFIRADGKVKKACKKSEEPSRPGPLRITLRQMQRLCKIEPQKVFIGVGKAGKASIAADARTLLKQRKIPLIVLPLREAIEKFQTATERRAIYLNP